MIKWEYKVLREGIGLRGFRVESIEEELNLWGQEGWELVGVTRHQSEFVAVFKRPIGTSKRREPRDSWF
jgi:hypothetical protein